MLLLLAWMLTAQADDLDDLLFERSLPDPAASAALSGFVGFGAGHAHAGNPDAAIHAVVQLFGLGAVIFAPVMAKQGGTPEGVVAVNVVGLVGLAGGRMVEVATAPRAARRAAERMIQARRDERAGVAPL